MLLTTEDVRAACDEAHDARGYTEATALAAILERMLLAKLAKAEPVGVVQSHTIMYGICLVAREGQRLLPAGTKLYDHPRTSAGRNGGSGRSCRISARGKFA